MIIHRLTQHLLEEAERREIPRDVLEKVLSQPEQKVEVKEGRSAYQSRIHLDQKLFLIRVIVDEKETPPVAITVYRTSKIQKYWRLQ